METRLQTVDFGISDVGTIKEREEVEDTELRWLAWWGKTRRKKHTHGINVKSSFHKSLRSCHYWLVTLVEDRKHLGAHNCSSLFGAQMRVWVRRKVDVERNLALNLVVVLDVTVLLIAVAFMPDAFFGLCHCDCCQHL
jgi:hypothetical protein